MSNTTTRSGAMTDAVFVLLVARYETLTVSLQQRVDHALEIRLEIIREEKRLRAENRWYRPMADPEWDRLEAKREARDLQSDPTH